MWYHCIAFVPWFYTIKSKEDISAHIQCSMLLIIIERISAEMVFYARDRYPVDCTFESNLANQNLVDRVVMLSSIQYA